MLNNLSIAFSKRIYHYCKLNVRLMSFLHISDLQKKSASVTARLKLESNYFLMVNREIKILH